MASLAETLRALDVDVDVIADIDVLNEENVLERLTRALGGNWDEVRKEAIPVKSAIEQHKPWLNSPEIAKGIREILDKAPTSGQFPKASQDQIAALFKKASPWDAVKDAGKAAVPSGDATKQYDRLEQICSKFGLWIVPVGELEGFCKSEGNHGPKWVQRVIENHDLRVDPEIEAARWFVKNIWNRLPS